MLNSFPCSYSRMHSISKAYECLQDFIPSFSQKVSTPTPRLLHLYDVGRLSSSLLKLCSSVCAFTALRPLSFTSCSSDETIFLFLPAVRRTDVLDSGAGSREVWLSKLVSLASNAVIRPSARVTLHPSWSFIVQRSFLASFICSPRSLASFIISLTFAISVNRQNQNDNWNRFLTVQVQCLSSV